MFFFTNFFNGLKVANQIRKLVLSDKRLLLYPIIMVITAFVAGVAILGISIFAAIPLIAALSTSAVTSAALTSSILVPVLLFIAAVLAYFFVFFIASYFTVAMLLAFKAFMRGNKMGFGESISKANAYIGCLLGWSLFYAIITVILDIIEAIIRSFLRRWGFAGNIFSSVITGVANLALKLAATFALPIIIDQKTGPIATFKGSASFIIHNFGETFGGLIYSDILQYGLATVGGIVIFLAVLLTPLSSALATGLNSGSAGGFGGYAGAIALLILLVFIIVLSWNEVGSFILLICVAVGALLAPQYISASVLTLVAIGFAIITLAHLIKYVLFKCFTLIIYEYKTSGIVPAGIDKALLDSAVKSNPKGGGGGMGGGLGGILGGGFGGQGI